jgi:serine protease inhibitor
VILFLLAFVGFNSVGAQNQSQQGASTTSKNLKIVQAYKGQLAYDTLTPEEQRKIGDHDPNVTAEYTDRLKGFQGTFKGSSATAYIHGANRVGLDFLRAGYASDKRINRLYSPIAMATNFALLANLVQEVDRTAIQQSFGWDGLSLGEINSVNKSLLKYGRLYHRAYELDFAAGTWVDGSIAVSQEAKDRIADNFATKFHTFKMGQYDVLAQKINKWTKKKMKGHIESAVTGPELDDTNYFLANTVFLDAKWRVPFLTSQNGKFHSPQGTKSVPFMHGSQELPAKLLEEDKFYVVSMPYAYGTFTEVFGSEARGQAEMWIFVTKDGHALDEIVPSIDIDHYELWQKKFSSSGNRWFWFSMPRWSLVFKDSDFSSHLEKMGINSRSMRFDDGTQVKTTAMGQKAFIEVGEIGTTAGAVSYWGFMSESSIPPLSITVDEPFIYLIRDSLTGAILFSGVVTDPSEK